MTQRCYILQFHNSSVINYLRDQSTQAPMWSFGRQTGHSVESRNRNLHHGNTRINFTAIHTSPRDTPYADSNKVEAFQFLGNGFHLVFLTLDLFSLPFDWLILLIALQTRNSCWSFFAMYLRIPSRLVLIVRCERFFRLLLKRKSFRFWSQNEVRRSAKFKHTTKHLSGKALIIYRPQD